ncbi:MAG: TetR family transcriptional regulator C-terminal domain-containing protein [Thermodesulfobacteriota bacterium]
MKENTKQKILEAGAEIIHLKGFNHTGLHEILKAAGVPKGSFYNYFQSKDDFGLQVLDYFSTYFNELARTFLEDRSVSPLQRIKNLLESFIRYFQSKDCTRGCPVGNLAQEMGDLSPEFREKLEARLEAMIGVYAAVFKEAREAGEVAPDLEVEAAARFLVSSWHGALLHMKVLKTTEPLENHLKFIFSFLAGEAKGDYLSGKSSPPLSRHLR